MIHVTEDNMKTGRADYPCMKISDMGQIVLFTDERTGVNINGIGHGVGFWSDGWTEQDFVDYDGKIILENRSTD